MTRPTMAQVALERMEALVARLPDVERSDNPPGCYFLIRRKIFAQVATVVDYGGRGLTMVVFRPDPDEREVLLAVGHPYFSRGAWDDRLGRIGVVIEDAMDWSEIAELVTDSYRLTAPKKLVAQLDAQDGRHLPASASVTALSTKDCSASARSKSIGPSKST